MDSLIFPESIRLLLPEEIPVHDDHGELLHLVLAGQRTQFLPGYVIATSKEPDKFAALFEANVNTPALWDLVRALSIAVLPDHCALMIGSKEGDLHYAPYRRKTELLTALEPFGPALARDGFVQFGLIWQVHGKTEEIFVEPAKYLRIWTGTPGECERVLMAHGLGRMEELSFLDEFPRVTTPISHPPEMYQYDELIDRVIAADAGLPEAVFPDTGA